MSLSTPLLLCTLFLTYISLSHALIGIHPVGGGRRRKNDDVLGSGWSWIPTGGNTYRYIADDDEFIGPRTGPLDDDEFIGSMVQNGGYGGSMYADDDDQLILMVPARHGQPFYGSGRMPGNFWNFIDDDMLIGRTVDSGRRGGSRYADDDVLIGRTADNGNQGGSRFADDDEFVGLRTGPLDDDEFWWFSDNGKFSDDDALIGRTVDSGRRGGSSYADDDQIIGRTVDSGRRGGSRYADDDQIIGRTVHNGSSGGSRYADDDMLIGRTADNGSRGGSSYADDDDEFWWFSNDRKFSDDDEEL